MPLLKNILGTGWKTWSIAAFTTFLTCFVKLSVKSSSAAKLFNAVHKAQVSWNRIRPLMSPQQGTDEENETEKTAAVDDRKNIGENTGAAELRLVVQHLNFSYPGGKQILDDISFTAKQGQMIGITGTVACGKSTLGKAFLCEYPYEGQIFPIYK